MDKFIEALREKREGKGILQNFGFCNDIEKGHFNDIFEHGAEKRGFTIDKRGKDIKERLGKLLSKVKLDIESHLVRMGVLETAIKAIPTKKASDLYEYRIGEWADVITDLPDGYEICYGCCDESDTPLNIAMEGPANPALPSKESEIKMKSEYNSNLYDLIGLKIDEAMINTMISNFKDDATYSLTVKEASILGW